MKKTKWVTIMVSQPTASEHWPSDMELESWQVNPSESLKKEINQWLESLGEKDLCADLMEGRAEYLGVKAMAG